MYGSTFIMESIHLMLTKPMLAMNQSATNLVYRNILSYQEAWSV